MIKELYLHCPVCYKLDRHFEIDGQPSGVTFCTKCNDAYPTGDFQHPVTDDKWEVQRIGSEISFVRRRYLIGRISYGWFGPDKILVANTQGYDNKRSPLDDAIFELAKQNIPES